MGKHIPTDVHEAILAELDADSPEYRDAIGAVDWVKTNRGPSPLLTFRVPADALEQLQALAVESGVAVSTLARGFILDGLAARNGDSLQSALDRLERDLATVKARALAS